MDVEERGTQRNSSASPRHYVSYAAIVSCTLEYHAMIKSIHSLVAMRAAMNESGWIGQDGTNTYHGIDFG